MKNNPTCRNLVVKIASRCNLNCKYCYMYNMGDESYKLQPKLMSDMVMIQMFNKVKEHCIENNIQGFTFILHGGEPLLSGKKFVEKFVHCAKNILSPKSINVRFSLQTNGLLLDESWCHLLSKLGITIGISIDGLKEDNDANRIDHSGRGSYDRIIKAIKISHKSNIDVGVLSVININSNPIQIYNHFKEIGIKSVDFLIPEATYQSLPAKPIKGQYVKSKTPYADWLIDLFDIWINDENRLNIRRFNQYIHSIMGGDINGDEMGNLHNEVLVVETNGTFEAVDALKVCGESFTKTNTTVMQSSISDALKTDLAEQYYYSHFNLPKKCIVCPINETCGGGYIPHRYNIENGFNNPSVYCNDLLKLIIHIQNKIVEFLPAPLRGENGINKLSYNDAIHIIEKKLLNAVDPNYSYKLENFRR
ncbi:radical SAM protein [Elizabethkingia argentiflava]|uniref:Radical SAM protein n=1 Tax=Elizabethkingia argenteiflava TaxID=2681556 RepID=A0A845PXN7_9FLAO|nr:radical SAM protein [Elizabethkingia argenteiflava]NAW51606.1 radical SAM protein [Elizabethkingia argenteiflava]